MPAGISAGAHSRHALALRAVDTHCRDGAVRPRERARSDAKSMAATCAV